MTTRKSGMSGKSLPPIHRRTAISAAVACLCAASGAMLVAQDADARTTRIQIISQGTAFGGFSFPGVGQYERIVGKAFGELNPTDLHNTPIVDLQLAPRNASGRVEYSHDFYILKPVDLSKGNHKMMYEPPNRGGKTYSTLNRTTGGGDDPASITNGTVLANSYLWTRGYTTVWSGWEGSPPQDRRR